MKFVLIIIVIFSSCKNGDQHRKIIDAHFHAFPFDQYGYPPPPNEVTGFLPPANNNEKVYRNMIEEMDRYNIRYSIASGPLKIIKEYQAIDSLRFIGGYYFSPATTFTDTSEFIQLIKNGSIRVLGELGLQYAGLALTDSIMIPYLDICNRYEIPVALHTGLGDAGTPYQECCKNFRTHLGDPQIIEEVLIRYPKLKVQLMHAGWPYIERTKAILYMYPQVNVDIAVINWALPLKEFHNYLEALTDAGFTDRIMYGSDQMIWEDVFKISIQNIESAPFLSNKQKEDIFYNNAKSFFNIKG